MCNLGQMLRATYNQSDDKRKVRFHEICYHAKQLGVTREHLYRVLTGERHSHSLMLRYEALKKTQLDHHHTPSTET